LFSFTLRSEGFEVIEAHSVKEALQLARQQRIDVVLAEAVLPEQDGLELCRQLSTDWRTRLIPVVLTTSLGNSEDRIRGLLAGADDFLIKPYDLRELTTKLRKLISVRSKCGYMHPLTKLPCSGLIRSYIEEVCLTEREAKWALLDMDINQFSAFNRLYGFAAGDRVLEMLGDLLREVIHSLPDPFAFAGHDGRDDFVAVVPIDHVETTCRQLIERFEGMIPGYYPPEHRQHLRADRHAIRPGSDLLVPRLGLSIGVVTSDLCEDLDYLEIREACLAMRARAKAHERSAFVINSVPLKKHVYTQGGECA
jgi:CheY-like chemotaxis protein